MFDSLVQYKRRLGAFVHRSRDYARLLWGTCYDLGRYCRSGIVGWRRNAPPISSIEALIIKEYHVIEKGLSMSEFRPLFGIPRVDRLIWLMRKFQEVGGDLENPNFGSARSCLEAYWQRHLELAISLDELPIRKFLDDLGGVKHASFDGGVRRFGKDEFFRESDGAFAQFSMSRRSCRDFSPEQPVAVDVVERAIEIARSAPSVCNRQSWKVHSYFERERIDSLLHFQNGNRGFGERIPCLLVVTVDLQCFEGAIERYQPWIDGGMFGMQLLLALHHLRLGAVPLNWSVLPDDDLGLRKTGQIPFEESVIMLVGVGHPSEEFYLPVSKRRDVHEIHRMHGG